MAPARRVLAVSFLDSASADAAAAFLRREYPTDSAIRVVPLGHPEYPTPAGTLVTGRFGADVVAAVSRAVHEFGGTVEMNVAFLDPDP